MLHESASVGTMIEAARSNSSPRSAPAASRSLSAPRRRAARSWRLRSVISTTIEPTSTGTSSLPRTG